MLCCTSTLPHFFSSFDKDQLAKSFATAGKSALKLANLPSLKMMGVNGAKIRLLYKTERIHSCLYELHNG